MSDLVVKTAPKKLSQEEIEDRRQGRRVNLRFEIEVSGKNSKGEEFRAATYTRDVSEKGCCFGFTQELFAGDLVALRVVHRNGPGKSQIKDPHYFHVAWVTRKDGAWLVGAEMVKPGEVWGVSFPPKSMLRNPA